MGGEHIQACAFAEAKLAEGSLDVIVCFHVLEHVAEPIATLARFRQWLRPGGTLWLEVPNLLNRVQGYGSRFHQAHVQHFTPVSLALAMAEAGLATQAVEAPATTSANLRLEARCPNVGETVASPRLLGAAAHAAHTLQQQRHPWLRLGAAFDKFCRKQWRWWQERQGTVAGLPQAIGQAAASSLAWGWLCACGWGAPVAVPEPRPVAAVCQLCQGL